MPLPLQSPPAPSIPCALPTSFPNQTPWWFHLPRLTGHHVKQTLHSPARAASVRCPCSHHRQLTLSLGPGDPVQAHVALSHQPEPRLHPACSSTSPQHPRASRGGGHCHRSGGGSTQSAPLKHPQGWASGAEKTPTSSSTAPGPAELPAPSPQPAVRAQLCSVRIQTRVGLKKKGNHRHRSQSRAPRGEAHAVPGASMRTVPPVDRAGAGQRAPEAAPGGDQSMRWLCASGEVAGGQVAWRGAPWPPRQEAPWGCCPSSVALSP